MPTPSARLPLPQDGGKFRVSRKAVLAADGLLPAPSSGAATSASDSEEGGEAPEVGRVYRGCRITGITSFGAFVEVGGGQLWSCGGGHDV